ncbi:hypothetical protein Acr_18g0001570 [Actinidia rufa]|uniref:Uncharacterized protein n=1 Tax=Actinidia rufa TaxID=165716 RepID=A0A7J0G5D9_9ERIC|nr:hypothetical protein Acr_18g0001570 [Actinidia rufa]
MEQPEDEDGRGVAAAVEERRVVAEGGFVEAMFRGGGGGSGGSSGGEAGAVAEVGSVGKDDDKEEDSEGESHAVA